MKGYKKLLLGLLGFFLVFSMFASQVNRAEAGFPTAELMSVPTALKTIWEKRGTIITSIKNRIVNDLLTRNVAMYMDNLAYNTAQSLSTGAPGSKPLHETSSWGDVFKKTNEAAIGNFIGELTEIEDFQSLGLNLCNPSIRDVQFKLTIPLYLIDSAAPPKPKCNWNSIQANWKNFDAGLKDNLLIVQLQPTHRDVPGTVRNGEEGKDNPWKNYNDFWDGFSYSQSDFGLFMELDDIARQRQEDAQRAKQAQIAACNDYIAKETTVTKEVVTTCSKVGIIVEQSAEAAFSKTADKQAGELGSGGLLDNIGKIMLDAGNRFVNTYSSRLMNDWLKGGTFRFGYGDLPSGHDDLRDSLLDRLRGGSNIRNPKDIKIARTNVAPNIAQLSGFSLIDDFSVCPPDASYRHPDNCVISTQFLGAVNSRTTIKQAIKEGLLNGNLPFIGPDDLLRNLSDDCYLTGLCHSNLSKLRKANIIPIGWEMAALRSPITSPITLIQAMNCFEDFDDGSGNCLFSTSTDYMVDGEGHNPFYHLVDPNWVLKIPEVTCDAFIYSPVLESGDSSNRLQYCADVKTCLREDKDGNCLDGNYGYCTKSENIWSFNANVCEDGELYSGCLTFDNEIYGQNSYIESSLDYCTSDEVGCRRYSQERNEDGNWVFDDIDTDDDDLFLNDRSNTCPSSEVGCGEYIIMAADTGTNLIPNGSFDDLDGDGLPDGWSGDGIDDPTGVSSTPSGLNIDYDGNRLPNGYSYGSPHYINTERVYMKVPLIPNTIYNISAEAAQYHDSRNDEARIVVLMCDEFGNCGGTSLAAPVANIGTCILPDSVPEASGHNNTTDLRFRPEDTDMERHGCSFMTNEDVAYAHVDVLHNGTLANAALWFDNIKLEVVTNPNQTETSVYSYYGDGGRVYMNDDTFMCLAEEVGCMAYRPANGDPMIPAVANINDICPAECVGYSTFAEQLNNFDVIEGITDVEYHNFIADNAQSCPLQEVGCDEFTNLDELARGGESTEYYSYLRQCVSEDDPRAAVYFTWEGSDVSGYQLKRWLTLQSNAVGIPGPCTNINPGSNACTDDVNPMALCGSETPATILDDPQFDPNCREFIDSNGNSFFRLQDQVVFASDECRDYRRSTTGTVYRAISSLSFSCAAENNGCRSYVGNTDNNLREVFLDNFEDGTYSPWTSSGDLSMSSDALGFNSHSLRASIDEITSRPFMEEGMKVDREYEVSFWIKNESVLDTLVPVIAVETPGFTYNIVMSTSTEFNNIEAGNWHYYKASIYIAEADIGGDVDDITAVHFELNPSSAAAGGYVYIDNVVLKEVIKNTSVIKDSWVTPVSCDTPYTGYHLGCQSYVDINGKEFNFRSFNSLCREEAIGCLPAIDTQNSSNPFEQTYNPSSCSDGVSATKVICEAVPEVWTEEYSEITVSEDALVYLVPDKGNYCAQHFKGCQSLGLQSRTDPNLSSTVYKINDPDKYSNTLCLNEALNCLDYNSAKGTYYFKDPMYNTCTYKRDVNIDDHIVSGWFSDFNIDETTGIAFGCSDTLGSWYDSGSFDFDDLDQADVALNCPSDKNLCTGFRDLNDPENCDPNIIGVDGECSDGVTDNQIDCEDAAFEWTFACEVYYYYNDDNIDEGSCNGQVDQNGGCMLFSDENYWNGAHDEIVSLYDSAQTYSKNISTARPLSPIVCGDWDPSCNLDANRLINVRQDRQCGEWLSCKSSAVVLDPNTKSYRVICDEIGTCDKYSTDNNISTCAHWLDEDDDIAPLSTEVYQSRSSGANGHIAWSDYDYTGYSIPGMLPVSELITYNFQNNSSTGDNTRLVYGSHDAIAGLAEYHTACVDPAEASITEPYNGDYCLGTVAGEEFVGECDGGLCWVAPIVGETSASTFMKEVRGYAVIDAPFSSDIAERNNRKSGYSGANICNINPDSDEYNCEDDYIKVTYGEGGSVRYYSENDDNVLPGICLSGRTGFTYYDDGSAPTEVSCTMLDPRPCNTRIYNASGDLLEEKPDGMCQEITKIETVNNWPGVCLDYDYSTQLIGADGETRYYCNQWYPVNKIQGTNSLYNNYREAGYYNEAGKDILYCAIAEPYVLSKERIYCGSVHNDTCGALLVVPVGAKVNMGGLMGHSELLSMGYLKEEVIPIYELRDSSYLDDNGVAMGMDTLVKTPFARDHVNGGVPSAGTAQYWTNRFGAGDFEHPNYELIQTSFDELTLLFDAEIDIYYYDEDIWHDGNQNVGGRVRLPEYSRYSAAECDQNKNVDQWMRDNGRWCDTTEHIVYASFWYGGSDCSWFGPRHHNGRIECNPLPYNYYVKAESVNPTIECVDTNCSSGQCSGVDAGGDSVNCSTDATCAAEGAGVCVVKGLACMLNATLAPTINSMLANPVYYNTSTPVGYCTYSNVRCGEDANCTAAENCLTWPWPGDIYSLPNGQPDCAGNLNCEFLRCTWESLVLAGNWDIHDDIVATAVPPRQDIRTVGWCADYGSLEHSNFSITLANGAQVEVNYLTSIEGCFDILYEEVEEIGPFGPYPSAELRAGVNVNVESELFGVGDNTTDGCLNGAIEAACVLDTRVVNPASCTRSSYSAPVICNYYQTSLTGTDCGLLNSCYYQCGVVTELDAEGENSWVRTDVWWRSKENTSEGRLQPVVDSPWKAYFYNVLNGAYEPEGMPSLLTNYYNIEGQANADFTHFGGSIGGISEGLVVTKVDFSADATTFGHNTASVFFHGTNTTPLVKENWNDPDNANLDAARQLVWLFGRTYNLQWNGIEYVNPEDMVPASEIPHLSKLFVESGAFEAGYTIANPIMGDDYNPRIFKVCENGYCKIKDSVTDEFLYNAEGMTINNISEPADGDPKTFVYGHGGTLFTAIKFYYHAHPDHMPVKNIAVDWSDGIAGDFVYNNSPGKYKNNLETCSDSALLPKADGKDQTEQGFGGLDRACREGYKVLYHTYEYDEQHLCNGTQAWMPDTLDASDEASCYQPKILVQDNWVQGGEVFFDGAVVVFKD